MFIKSESLDDLLNEIYQCLLKEKFDISTTKGKTSEVIATHIQLENPRARLSRSEGRGRPFSAIGELFWYLSKSNNLEQVCYYIPSYKECSDDNQTIQGAYGPRLFSMRNGINQVNSVISLLKKKPTSRRAVIQLFNAEDLLEDFKDIPCTCTLQFTVREKRLIMIVSMRSNDAFIGLPHDIFTFTMLQEIIARSLNVDVGTYHHFVGSLHLYENNKANIETYLSEGWHSTMETMPPMPETDPWSDINKILKAEHAIRSNGNVDILNLNIDPYWADILRLIQVHSLLKEDKFTEVKKCLSEMNSNFYDTYIVEKLANKGISI